MSFSRNFYRAAAVCSFISAATTLLLIFPPKFYGPVTSLELRIELVDHPLYQLRAWAYLLHPFMVMTAAVGVAAALRRTAAGTVVPGLLGIAFVTFGAILLARRQAPADHATEPVIAPSPDAAAPADTPAPVAHGEFDWRRVALSWLLCITYGGVLLGGGLPYWVLTAAFLFLHVLLLDETSRVPASPTLRRLVIAAVVAPAVATAVMLTFQHVFLVRLP